MKTKLHQNRFEVAPSSANYNRSQFNIPYKHLTTMNFGKLVPFYCEEVLPGDTFEVSTKMLARMSTPLYPVMDNAFIDYTYFFVPTRLVWSHWAEFMGENKLKAWVQDIEYTVPHAKFKPVVGGLLDHFGIPTYSENGYQLDCQVLPFRCYQLIWNEWWRNENTTDPVLVNTGDDVTLQELENTDRLLNVSKFFDYFTSALPSPQKGDAVDIPLGDYAPLRTYAYGKGTYDGGFVSPTSGEDSVLFQFRNSVETSSILLGHHFDGETVQDNSVYLHGLGIYDGTFDGSDAGSVTGLPNLAADLSQASTITVNALRQSFQMQRLLELQARSGTRYIEIIKASFGVLSPDARLQRPEYLGGTRVDIQMQQVAQTSSTDAQSPLGHTGAYSKTLSGSKDFTCSFTEHGFVIGVMCARTSHTYQQGLHKMWSRRGRYDFYWPTFANIGEQPILKKEIFAIGNDSVDNEVFGYNEAWAEYRYKPNQVTGAFRSTVSGNLDEWHYADYYENVPTLSQGFMEETAVNVDRTLAVTSELHDQLILDIRVNNKASRVMPLYSIPGLIDHM